MQANSAEHQSLDTSSRFLGIASGLTDPHQSQAEDATRSGSEPTYFHGQYSSCMEMYADAATVAAYLDSHHDWFKRCAHPMTADPLGETGYALTIGKFGSFGYEVEPKIGLDLLPQDQGIYRIETIDIPNYKSQGYDVDFKAELSLVETAPNPAQTKAWNASKAKAQMPEKLTRVEWELNLVVTIQFPRFINALPQHLIQTTGDRLLNQIVRQASRCLTYKVQEDFHSSLQLPFPHKPRRVPFWHRGANNAAPEAE